MFSPVPTNTSDNNSSLTTSSASSSSHTGSRAGTPTTMEVVMNGVSYIIVNPTALAPVEQTNAFVSLEWPDGNLPIQTVLQELSINDLSSSKCSSEDVLDMEAPIEKVPLKKAISHEKDSLGYSAEEQVALLSCISATPNSFNASESSPEGRAVHQKMLEAYNQMGVGP